MVYKKGQSKLHAGLLTSHFDKLLYLDSTRRDIDLFLATHLEALIDAVNDVLVLWFTCAQYVDHDYHDANDGGAVQSIKDVAFCKLQIEATLV